MEHQSALSGTGPLLAGRYRLVEPLASGGMGTVWRAHDQLLDRPVAVKEVLLPAGLDDEAGEVLRRRTLREARAAARLRHPAIVTIFDVVEQDGRPWIVMELVPSQSLDQVLRIRGALQPMEAAGIALRILDALVTAHAAGVEHRDIKPANVLLAEDGRVVLTDFGIARHVGDETLTSAGLLVGSPNYLAPERARGLDSPGLQSDLWSLGATLYAAVEGRPPFERNGPLPTLAAVVMEDPAPVRRAGPLRPVIEALLVKDPARRIDADGGRAMLQRVLRGQPAVPPADGTDRTRPLPVPPPPPARGRGTGPGDAPVVIQPTGESGPDVTAIITPVTPEPAGPLAARAAASAPEAAPASGDGSGGTETGARGSATAGTAAARPERSGNGAGKAGVAAGVAAALGGLAARRRAGSEAPRDVAAEAPTEITTDHPAGAPAGVAAGHLANAPAAMAADPAEARTEIAAGPAAEAPTAVAADPAEAPTEIATGDTTRTQDREPLATALGGHVTAPPRRPVPVAPPIEPRRDRRRPALVAAALVLLAALAALLVPRALDGDGSRPTQAAPGAGASAPAGDAPATQPGAATRSAGQGQPGTGQGSAGTGQGSAGTGPSAAPTGGGEAGTTPGTGPGASAPTAATGQNGGAAVQPPPGFRRYTDPRFGFSLVVPEGWTPGPGRNGEQVDFDDPSSGRFLRIETTDRVAADPYRNWIAYEQAEWAGRPGYQRIEIKPVDYGREQGWTAADWEFRYGGNHVLDRNIRVSADRAHALYWSTPESLWNTAESRRIFDLAAASFVPAPST